MLLVCAGSSQGDVGGGKAERRRAGQAGTPGRAAAGGGETPAGGAAEGEDGEDPSCGR